MSPLLGKARGMGAAGLLLLLAACGDPMIDQPRYDELETSAFFADGQAARPLVPGTVPRGHLREDELLHTGKIGGELADVYPFEITREVLERGRERFNIYCAPCHDQSGHGRGMVVQRGFMTPPTYHSDRLRSVPVGHFVEVISSGFGSMPDYSHQVPPRDRWAIAAYIRALQLSQNAPLDAVPEDERARLTGEGR